MSQLFAPISKISHYRPDTRICDFSIGFDDGCLEVTVFDAGDRSRHGLGQDRTRDYGAILVVVFGGVANREFRACVLKRSLDVALETRANE